MTVRPSFRGRLYPRADWEGDDFTPGAGGAFVSCQDTACGRLLAWATNGKVDLDGKVIRARIADSGGVTLTQVADAVKALTGRKLNHGNKTLAQIDALLLNGHGLVVDGAYGQIERAYRFQANADFNHAIFIPVLSAASGYRVYDPLNPDTHAYGRWIPRKAMTGFITSLGGLVGWMDNE